MKARWLFFTLFASYSVPGRFMSIFYQEHNIDETHIGLLMATTPLVTLVFAPLFCNIADRIGRREDVAFRTYAGYITAFLFQIIANPSLNLIPIQLRFPFLFFTRVILSACYSASYPLVSAITISQLKQEHGPKGHERFGQERLWGAVSWAACSFMLGTLLDMVANKVWLVHAGVLFFGALFLHTLRRFKKDNAVHERVPASDSPTDLQDESSAVDQGAVDEETGALGSQSDKRNDSAVSTAEAVSRIMCSDGMIAPVFFNLIFWLAAGMSLVENLLFLFFENELHASNLLCGISVVVTVVVEIPIFAKAPNLLENVGASMLAMIGSSSFVIRGMGYSFSPNGWVALLNEPLHGITYGSFHTATVAYIADRSPPELEATGQSVLQVVQSLGQILGTSTGGYVMQQYGSKILYRGAALIVLVATLAFGTVDRLSKGGSPEQTSQASHEGMMKNTPSDEMVALTTAGE